MSSLCSLSFQGSLALEGLVITLATLVLLAEEIELSSPHPLWVLFPTSLPARGHLTGETQVFCLSRVRPREAGEDPVFTVADSCLSFTLFPSQLLSLLTSWVKTGPEKGGGQFPLPLAPTASPED